MNVDIDKITSSASELKYLDILKEFPIKNFANPNEKLIAAKEEIKKTIEIYQ
ncbi:hypothetical protein GHK52_03725 [Lactococcus garvieae]|nr:hypothetical protein [Lactococcus garvieae]